VSSSTTATKPKGIRVIDYSQSGWRAGSHADLLHMADDFAIIKPGLVILCVTENDFSGQLLPATVAVSLTGSPVDLAFTAG